MSAKTLKPSAHTLVIIPTYNEKENLPLIVDRVRTTQPDVHILIAVSYTHLTLPTKA